MKFDYTLNEERAINLYTELMHIILKKESLNILIGEGMELTQEDHEFLKKYALYLSYEIAKNRNIRDAINMLNLKGTQEGTEGTEGAETP